jgi:hypothetical protein
VYPIALCSVQPYVADFFLLNTANLQYTPLSEAMSKCAEGVGHVGRSHSPMTLRQNIIGRSSV